MSVADEGGEKLENEVENKNVEFESRKKNSCFCEWFVRKEVSLNSQFVSRVIFLNLFYPGGCSQVKNKCYIHLNP